MQAGKPKAGGFCFKPDTVIWRKRLFRRNCMYCFSVPVAGRGRNINQKRHKWPIIAILDAVPVLVGFQPQGSIFACKEKHPKAASAPSSAHFKGNTISKPFWFVTGCQHPESYNCSSKIDREPPCQGSQIELTIGKIRVGNRFLQFQRTVLLSGK